MRLALTLAVCLLPLAVFAQPGNLITNGDFANGTAGWSIPSGGRGSARLVDCDLPGLPKAIQVVAKPEPGDSPWAVTLHTPLQAFLDEGQPLTIKLWARSPERAPTAVFLEQAGEPYAKSVYGKMELTPDWREFEFEGKSLQAFSPGEAHLGFHLAHASGTIELAGIRLLTSAQTSQGERPTMNEPASIIENGDFSQPLQGNWPTGGTDRLSVEIIDVDVPGYTRGVRLISTPPESANAWDVQFGQTCRGYVYPGDAVYFRAWLRSPDNCPVTFIYELNRPPHSKHISQMVRLSPEWREYRFVGRPDRGYRPGDSRVSFFLGNAKGVVEVAGVRVENFGPAPDTAFTQTIDYWGGRAHPDDWREPALQRIEQLRKGDLRITVTDPAGNPVPDAVVKIEQLRHAFRFGTAAPAGRFLDQTNPDNLRFQQEVERLYNTVTFENDLKWPAMSDGNTERVERAIDWLHQRGIQVRGHCLLWGSFQHLHASIRDLRGPELLEACKAHVTDYARRFDGKLYLWDVVNEAGSNVEVWNNIGWEAFPDSFRWAREADPDVQLCYNDYGIVNENPVYRAKVAARIRQLLDAGAPVDVLGIQAHMNTPLTPIHRVLEIMDEWADFGLPLEITEFDLGCPDDQVHADYVRDFMIAAFSHPKLQAFIMWGFWEGSHWRAKDSGAMFRRDWSPRPAQEAWEDLVFNQWWTRADEKTDNAGSASTRAFYGKHRVTVESAVGKAGAEIELLPGAPRDIKLVVGG